jgi:hypothetical protein
MKNEKKRMTTQVGTISMVSLSTTIIPKHSYIHNTEQDPLSSIPCIEFNILVTGQVQYRRRQQERQDTQQLMSFNPSRIGLFMIPSNERSCLFDCASLLFSGEARRKLHQIIPLPNCWDELLDWTVEATNLTAIIHTHQSGKGHQQTHRRHATTIRFIPFVDSSQIDKVGQLPCTSRIERATFFAESVS